MPQPSYNPWGTPMFPNTGSAFGVGSPAEAAERQPTFVDSLLSHIAGALGRGFMAPGQALNSTTPITSEQMIAPAQDMSTMMSAGAGAVPAQANELRMGIKAYHGSPHDFDRFDLSKIGTGEGAQAYGHGLYFAENEGVAEAYKTSVTRNVDQLTDIARAHGLTGDAADMLAHQFSTGFGGQRFDDWIGGLRTAVNDPLLSPRVKAAAQQLSDKSVEASDAYAKMKTPGKMYEVNLNADPAHFLDWDKPLSAQSDAVREALTPQRLGLKEAGPVGQRGYYGWVDDKNRLIGTAKTGGLPESMFNPNEQGMSLYRGTGTWKPGEASEILKNAGIPGIRYLDQGSRNLRSIDEVTREIARIQDVLTQNPQNKNAADLLKTYQAQLADAQKGTSNYVMFDDRLIDILRKYGIAGMTAPPIFANAMSEQKQ